MSQLMMDSGEVLLAYRGTHFEAYIVSSVHVPRAGMAHHRPPLGLLNHRMGPEALGQRREAKAHVELLRRFDHRAWIVVLVSQLLCNVQALSAGERSDEIIQRTPLLGPHVSQQMCINTAVSILYLVTSVNLPELATHIAVQVCVQALQLRPSLADGFLEFLVRHVVAGSPHVAHVHVASVVRAHVGEVDILFKQRTDSCANCIVPAFPGFSELLLTAGGLHQLLKLWIQGTSTFVLRRGVYGLHFGNDLLQTPALVWVLWRSRIHSCEHLQLSPVWQRKLLDDFLGEDGLGPVGEPRRGFCGRSCSVQGSGLGQAGDVRLIIPFCLIDLLLEVAELRCAVGEKLPHFCGLGCGLHQNQQCKQRQDPRVRP
mmetsp:Transcript_5334/g.15936  ORF Transcript_5334/g.15936 Transcript_5334/m.15936 type:complete len:371 (+) Transcript_5334:1063-2175(+)